MSCNASAAASKAKGPEELPSGMDAEAQLIEQLTSIPQISKVICRASRNTGGRGVDITVRPSPNTLNHLQLGQRGTQFPMLLAVVHKQLDLTDASSRHQTAHSLSLKRIIPPACPLNPVLIA